MYEVELKFPLTDPKGVVSQLTTWGASPGEVLEQCDTYFNHPARDFGETDEAFRVRSMGDQNAVTYKGPVVDAQTKTRLEIEIEIASGQDARQAFCEMLVRLGFRPVRDVRKRRTPYRLQVDGQKYEIAIDDIAGLGTFIEIETESDEAGRPAAQQAVLALATRLSLTAAERRSYLSLLLEQD